MAQGCAASPSKPGSGKWEWLHMRRGGVGGTGRGWSRGEGGRRWTGRGLRVPCVAWHRGVWVVAWVWVLSMLLWVAVQK